MLIFLKEFDKIIKSMLDHEVEFLIIGGYAVNFHGYGRATGDIDFLLRDDNVNKNKFIKMLEAENFNKESVNKVGELDFTEANVFHIGKPPKRIDFLTKISGVNFDDAWDKKEYLFADNYKIPFIDLQNLVLSKIANDRSRDKTDIEELQKIAKIKKK